MNLLLKYLGRSLKSIFMRLAGIFVVPVALLQAGRDRLPAWAQAWDNDREPFGDTARGPAISTSTGLKHLWLRYMWLGWRNPANNFGRTMGELRMPGQIVTSIGNPNTSDQGEQGYHVLILKPLEGYSIQAFEFYFVWAYSATRCVRIRLGWKLWDNPAPIVHVINPFDSFTGVR